MVSNYMFVSGLVGASILMFIINEKGEREATLPLAITLVAMIAAMFIGCVIFPDQQKELATYKQALLEAGLATSTPVLFHTEFKLLPKAEATNDK